MNELLKPLNLVLISGQRSARLTNLQKLVCNGLDVLADASKYQTPDA